MKTPFKEYCELYSIQFLHQITTFGNPANSRNGLYSIQFLHQITTLQVDGRSADLVVQYPISTSNHNYSVQKKNLVKLYSIQFLHQITTLYFRQLFHGMLYSIQFLHQITTVRLCRCFGSWLYSIQFLHQITTHTEQQIAE